MSGDRLFLDTSFVVALYNRRDQHHVWAKALAPRLENAAEVWTTEAILIEIGNTFSAANRPAAAAFIERCFEAPGNLRVIPVDTSLLRRAAQLYRARLDKDWGMTDCISFVVMGDHGLIDAATTDKHFRQAGFCCLLEETGDAEPAE